GGVVAAVLARAEIDGAAYRGRVGVPHVHGVLEGTGADVGSRRTRRRPDDGNALVGGNGVGAVVVDDVALHAQREGAVRLPERRRAADDSRLPAAEVGHERAAGRAGDLSAGA